MTAPDMRVLDLDQLRRIAGDHAHRLIFATVSGAHLYGFPSRDSDVDLRGAHLLATDEVVGLRTGPQTVEGMWDDGGAEIDLVTHDLAKFGRLLLQRNGYVLEQLLSPLVVTSSEAHRELVALAPGCVTQHHVYHYLGFANTQRRLHARNGELKPLLYTFRVLLTGLHLMRSGEVQPHLPTLQHSVAEAPGYLPEFVQAKATGEHIMLSGVPGVAQPERIEADVDRLFAALEETKATTKLPERPSAAEAVHSLLVRERLSYLSRRLDP